MGKKYTKILYDDEVIPASSGHSKNNSRFVLEDDGETITLYDRSSNEGRFTKEEYNRFVSAVKNGETITTLYDKPDNEARFTKEEYNRFVSAIKNGKVSPI